MQVTVSVLHSESGAEGLLHRQSVRVDADNVLASGESLHVDGIRVDAINRVALSVGSGGFGHRRALL